MCSSDLADGQPAEGETPSEPNASTEVPAEDGAAETPSDTGDAPSISMPTQEQIDQATSTLHQAASTVLDALFGAADSTANDAA